MRKSGNFVDYYIYFAYTPIITLREFKILLIIASVSYPDLIMFPASVAAVKCAEIVARIENNDNRCKVGNLHGHVVTGG